MAIFWCDPYIESPSNGVDGTTGSGTLGSYSNPYSMNNLPNNTGYTAGDEIRLKALPTTGVWLTGPSWGTIAATDGVRWSAAPAQHSVIKYTSQHGAKTYLNWNTPNRLNTIAYPTPWQGASPKPDLTAAAYKLDPDYYLSDMVDSGQQYFFRGQDNVAVTLTAGWTSSSAQNGETIIQQVLPTYSQSKWFGGASIASNKMIVDAPELTIMHSTTSTSYHFYIYGYDVEVHDINERSGTGSSNDLHIFTAGIFKANSLVSGSYMNIYAPYYDTAATQGINRDIKYILGGYQFFNRAQGSTTVTSHYKFKDIMFYYWYGYDNSGSVWNYYDDFYVYFEQGIQNTYPTEMAVTASVAQIPHANIQYQKEQSRISPKIAHGENHSYRNYHYKTVERDIGYIGKGAALRPLYGDVTFRSFAMSSGATLENATYNNVKADTTWNSNYWQGKAWGVDKQSGRRVAFVPAFNNTAQDAMMMYNSTEYSNKLVYHFMPKAIGTYPNFMERIDMEMPTGVTTLTGSQAYKLKFTLAGTPVGSINLQNMRIEGNDTNSSWTLSNTSNLSITSASGGAGTVIYSGTLGSTTNMTGIQKFSLILDMQNTASSGVSKLCFTSVEMVDA